MDDRFGFLRQSPPSHVRPTEHTFHHRLNDSLGQVALQYWPPSRGTRTPPEHLVVFILGNPGLLNYYHAFLSHLHYLLPPSHAVLSTSHIGHSPHLPHPAEPLDLHEQLGAKVELLDSLRRYLDQWQHEDRRVGQGQARSRGAASRATNGAAVLGSTKISLMGHSVGSWFLVELMKRLPDHVQAGYMLFPTLGWIADSWNGRKLWPIFYRPVRPLLPYISYIFRPILSLTTFPLTTLSLLRSPETIRHCLHLSRSEMDHILAPDLQFIQYMSGAKVPDGEGLYGIWAGGSLDGWVGREGPKVRRIMRDQGDGHGEADARGRVRVVEGIPHAFCLSRHHSHHIAEIVANWIDPSLSADGEHSESDASLILSAMPM